MCSSPSSPQHLQCLPIPERMDMQGNLLTSWKGVTSDTAEPSSSWRFLERLRGPVVASSMHRQHLERAGQAFLPPRQQWGMGQRLQHPKAAPIHGDGKGARPCASMESTEPAQRLQLPQALQHPAVPETSLPEQQQR